MSQFFDNNSNNQYQLNTQSQVQPQPQPQVQQPIYQNPIFSPTKDDVVQDLNIPVEILNKPQFDSVIETGQVGEKVVSYMESKAKYIDLSLLEPGQHFEGLAWCLNSTVVANKLDFKTFDITMKLVDINGEIFTAKKWGITKSEVIKDTPVYIRGAVMYFNDSNNLYFRIDEYVHYNLSLPRSLFLKSIENLPIEKERFISNIDKLSQYNVSNAVIMFIKDMLINYKYVDNLENTTYKPNIGTKLGYKFKVTNTAIEIIDKLCDLQGKNDEFKGTIYTLLYIYMINLQMTQDANEDSNSISSYMLRNLFSGTYATDKTATDLLSKCCMFITNRYNKFNTETSPEGNMLQSVLYTIDNVLKN